MISNNKQANPIHILVKYETKPCLYHAFGCAMQVSSDESAKHTTECQFRPYKCVGDMFGLWTYVYSNKRKLVHLPVKLIKF